MEDFIALARLIKDTKFVKCREQFKQTLYQRKKL
ncbi:hypothetical protein Clst_1240 [Thermoclostridium stercorarium subsp. stercorarium DSM 8532]|jgi:hypothetical protein|nr:hypothetical protein Clst_1240 [Thermoclostridium stercorarium subsp. stercorarium DSM 8532]